MLNREAKKTIEEIAETFRVLLVTGPRQVGKTTLLKELMPENMNYVTLDDEVLRESARRDPKLFLEEHPWPLLIDEVQYAPELFPYIKMKVDEAKERSMYWLTGSQQFKLMNYEKLIRFWNLNGRTLNEDNEEKLKEKYLLRNIPKKTDLKSCLKSLSKEAYREISDYVLKDPNGAIDKLCQEIIKIFKDDIAADEELSNILYECQNDIWDINVIDDMMIEFGQAFIYKDNGNVRVFMPDEIFGIVMDNMDDELDNDDLVVSYITMNGLISKKKLQELLKENHNIDISIKELDKIVSKTENLIKKDLYMMIDFEEDTKNLLDIKKMIPYRKADMLLMEMENDFFDELEEFFENHDLSNKIKDDVIGFFASTLKIATYSKEFFEYYLDNNGVKLNNKDKKELLAIVNRYKNDIPIWVYNGYTINEYNEMQKKTKVGRNDPCVCGSGKKYKKCCGKNN